MLCRHYYIYPLHLLLLPHLTQAYCIYPFLIAGTITYTPRPTIYTLILSQINVWILMVCYSTTRCSSQATIYGDITMGYFTRNFTECRSVVVIGECIYRWPSCPKFTIWSLLLPYHNICPPSLACVCRLVVVIGECIYRWPPCPIKIYDPFSYDTIT